MAGLEAGLEAMEIGIERKCKTDTWLGGGKPQGRPRGRPRGYGNCSKGETCLARIMEIAIDAMESGAKQTLG